MKQKHALAALIDDVRSANGWTDPDISARAESRGHKLSKSNISRIRNNPVVTLNLETVSALADGLGITKVMVANAALASMGIISHNSADLRPEDAIRADRSLSERDKMMVLTILHGLREASGDPAQGPTLEESRARNESVHGIGTWADGAKGRRNSRTGQKTKPVTDEHENVTPSGNDALDRLHQSKFDLAAKPAHGGISHDQDPDET